MKKFLQTIGSLKVALWIFLILGLVSLSGVFIPQRPGEGILHDIYNSLPFNIILFLCAVNLSACVATRILANLGQVFKKDFIEEPANFRLMKHHRELDKDGFADTAIIHLTKKLTSKGYSVTEKTGDDRFMLSASKGALSKVGSIILHLAVLLIFAGGLVSSRMGYVVSEKLGPHDTVAIENRDFRLCVDTFRILLNDEGRVKSYETDAELLDPAGKSLIKKTVRVNDPLIYQSIHFYQSAYGESPNAIVAARLRLTTGGLDTLLEAPYNVPIALPGGLALRLFDYYCHLTIDMQTRLPANISDEPENPALRAVLTGPNNDTLFNTWLFFDQPEFQGMEPSKRAKIMLDGYQPLNDHTVLQVRENPGVPYILSGILMLSIGLLMLLYIPVRRVYALAVTAQGRTRLLVSGNSNRFEEGFVREFGSIIDEPGTEGRQK